MKFKTLTTNKNEIDNMGNENNENIKILSTGIDHHEKIQNRKHMRNKNTLKYQERRMTTYKTLKCRSRAKKQQCKNKKIGNKKNMKF